MAALIKRAARVLNLSRDAERRLATSNDPFVLAAVQVIQMYCALLLPPFFTFSLSFSFAL